MAEQQERKRRPVYDEYKHLFEQPLALNDQEEIHAAWAAAIWYENASRWQLQPKTGRDYDRYDKTGDVPKSKQRAGYFCLCGKRWHLYFEEGPGNDRSHFERMKCRFIDHSFCHSNSTWGQDSRWHRGIAAHCEKKMPKGTENNYIAFMTRGNFGGVFGYSPFLLLLPPEGLTPPPNGSDRGDPPPRQGNPAR